MENSLEVLFQALEKEATSLEPDAPSSLQRIKQLVDVITGSEGICSYLEHNYKVSHLVEVKNYYQGEAQLNIHESFTKGRYYLSLKLKDSISLFSEDFTVVTV